MLNFNLFKMETEYILRRSIRQWIIFFIVSLIISGITAFAVETGLAWILQLWPVSAMSVHGWLELTHHAIKDMNTQYPFLAYGYDWLAFAHIVIAVFFIGPLRDPVRNKWIIQAGRIACVMVFPLAFIAGAARQIPFGWQLIDCSFGLIGLLPLTICYRKIAHLERVQEKEMKYNLSNASL